MGGWMHICLFIILLINVLKGSTAYFYWYDIYNSEIVIDKTSDLLTSIVQLNVWYPPFYSALCFKNILILFDKYEWIILSLLK